jgi:FkbM family methyltransferase
MITNTINRLVKSIFKAFGMNISRIGNTPRSPIVHHQIDLVFDVGANDGGYARSARLDGYKGRIVSFEPLPEAHKLLLEKSKNDANWIIHERCAVGSELGEAEINISQNSASSSLLPMLESHSLAAPTSVYIGKATTAVITMDSIFNFYCKGNEKIFLKIDTQGFETEVLKGVSRNLENIFAVQLELSTVLLYENQDLYKYFFNFFEKNEFILWSIVPGFYDPLTGQSLQFDAIFVRNNGK